MPPLRDVIARFGLSARRRLGQHFLLDLNLTARVARCAGHLDGLTVIEVGPGPGGLTRSLLATSARRVIAIERDARCVLALRELEQCYPERLTVIEADALTVEMASLAPPPRCIVANLPYNVATPLLISWLRHIRDFESLTLMLQKEVADRLAAVPGTGAYGRLTVIVQWLCRVERMFNVDRKAFTPPPKVTSSVVRLRPLAEPLDVAEWSSLEAVTAAAFSQRRKMLRSSLRPIGLDPEDAAIDPRKRAEELDVSAFCALARVYAGRAGTVPADAG